MTEIRFVEQGVLVIIIIIIIIIVIIIIIITIIIIIMIIIISPLGCSYTWLVPSAKEKYRKVSLISPSSYRPIC